MSLPFSQLMKTSTNSQMRRKCLLRDHHRGARSLRGQDRWACSQSASWHSVTGKGYSPLPKKNVSTQLGWLYMKLLRPCKCSISANTALGKQLTTSRYHHSTAAEQHRSPGRYEPLPAITFLFYLDHGPPAALMEPVGYRSRSREKVFLPSLAAFPFWNIFLKQSLLHNAKSVSSAKQ